MLQPGASNQVTVGPDPCHSQLLITVAEQPPRNVSFIFVKSQDAVFNPSSLPWRWGVGVEDRWTSLGLPLTPGLGRRKCARTRQLMCSSCRPTCVNEHAPSTHANTYTGSFYTHALARGHRFTYTGLHAHTHFHTFPHISKHTHGSPCTHLLISSFEHICEV